MEEKQAVLAAESFSSPTFDAASFINSHVGHSLYPSSKTASFSTTPDSHAQAVDEKLVKLSKELELRYRQLNEEFTRGSSRLNTTLPGTIAKIEHTYSLFRTSQTAEGFKQLQKLQDVRELTEPSEHLAHGSDEQEGQEEHHGLVDKMIIELGKLSTNLTSVIDMLSEVSSWESAVERLDALLDGEQDSETLFSADDEAERFLKAEEAMNTLKTSVSMLQDFPGHPKREEKLTAGMNKLLQKLVEKKRREKRVPLQLIKLSFEMQSVRQRETQESSKVFNELLSEFTANKLATFIEEATTGEDLCTDVCASVSQGALKRFLEKEALSITEAFGPFADYFQLDLFIKACGKVRTTFQEQADKEDALRTTSPALLEAKVARYNAIIELQSLFVSKSKSKEEDVMKLTMRTELSQNFGELSMFCMNNLLKGFLLPVSSQIPLVKTILQLQKTSATESLDQRAAFATVEPSEYMKTINTYVWSLPEAIESLGLKPVSPGFNEVGQVSEAEKVFSTDLLSFHFLWTFLTKESADYGRLYCRVLKLRNTAVVTEQEQSAESRWLLRILFSVIDAIVMEAILAVRNQEKLQQVNQGTESTKGRESVKVYHSEQLVVDLTCLKELSVAFFDYQDALLETMIKVAASVDDRDQEVSDESTSQSFLKVLFTLLESSLEQ